MFISVAKFSVRQKDSKVFLRDPTKRQETKDKMLKFTTRGWRIPCRLLRVPDRRHIILIVICFRMHVVRHTVQRRKPRGGKSSLPRAKPPQSLGDGPFCT